MRIEDGGGRPRKIRNGRWTGAVLTLVAAALLAPRAVAAEPVAMILVAPDRLAGLAFVEIFAGDAVVLEPAESLEALDYRRCEEIRVTGGRVEARPGGLRVEGGERRVLLDEACADTFAADAVGASTNLSVNLRSSSAEADDKAVASGGDGRVARVVLRFAPLLAEVYRTALVGADGLETVPAPTDEPLAVKVPDGLADAAAMTLQIVLVADGRPPRALDVEVPLAGAPRPTKVVYVR